MLLDSWKHLKIKGDGGGSEPSCHRLVLLASRGGIHLEPGDNPLDLILSSPGLPEACQHFVWLLGILNVPPES